MTLTFDQAAYRNLLAEVAPKVIETQEEYDRALAVAEQLTFKKNRTPEERALHKLLVTLIEAYEAQNYPMDEAAPHEILQHILESSGTRQADLVGVIGSSGVVSEVVMASAQLVRHKPRRLAITSRCRRRCLSEASANVPLDIRWINLVCYNSHLAPFSLKGL
jgi:HTH-type transcriptional regulator/antitoxin HigA